MRILRPRDYKVMPWKNGGGTTTEIMVWPEGASVARGFDWRVSTANVAGDGPFSLFGGYRRKLMILSGEGLALQSPAFGEVKLRRADKAFEFDGGAELSSRLLGGPVCDFNVMYATSGKHQYNAALHRKWVKGHSSQRLLADFELLYAITGCFLADGEAVAPGDTLVVRKGEITGA